MRDDPVRSAPRPLFIAIVALLITACTSDARTSRDAPSERSTPAALGPSDGRELPPADLERVAVGDTAPDFRLESLRNGTVTLSDFRGAKDVVLVFFRGHW